MISTSPVLPDLQAEESVLTFLKQQNRPYNAQGVTDHLAQFGVKKAQAQRALDALVETGKITCKASPGCTCHHFNALLSVSV